MDLSTVQLKINSKTYKSRLDFCTDLELIVNNCIQYNGQDTCKFILYFLLLITIKWMHCFYICANTF